MFLKWLSLHIFAIACVAGWQTFEFEPIQEGRYIGGGVHIDSSNVDSAVSKVILPISGAFRETICLQGSHLSKTQTSLATEASWRLEISDIQSKYYSI